MSVTFLIWSYWMLGTSLFSNCWSKCWYEDVREYTLRFLSSCLSGEVTDHKFYMWTGSGGNGKSLLVKLLQHTLGDYSKTLDVSTNSPLSALVYSCLWLTRKMPQCQ